MRWARSGHSSATRLSNSASLAGFLNAWLEAVAVADLDSENLRLFPIEASVMLRAVEEFYLDTHEADL